MLQSIVEYLRIKLQALNIGTVYGLGELVQSQDQQYPAIYVGSGQYQSLADFDNHVGSLYFRLVAPVSNAPADGFIGGDDSYQRTYQLRVVAFVPKSVYNTDNNYIDDKIAHNIQAAIQSDDDSILSTSLKAQGASIEVSSWETNRNNVLGNEIINTLFENIPFEYAFIAVDFTVVITGSPACFETYGCDDEFIDYLELLRELVCTTDCADGTVSILNSLGNEVGSVTVESGGSANGLAPNSTTNVQDQNGNPLGQVTGISGTTNTQAVTVEYPDIQELVDTSTPTEISNAVINATDTDKRGEVIDGLTANAGGVTIYGTFPCGTNPTCVAVHSNGNMYVALEGGSVQIWSPAMVLLNTVTGFGSTVRHIRFNDDYTKYAVCASGQLRIMLTSDNSQVALRTGLTDIQSFDFKPSSSNLFWVNNSGVLKEINEAGAQQGSNITLSNVPRTWVVKRNGTNIWVGGDSAGGRLSYFDAVSRAVTDITFSGTTPYFVQIISGLAFHGPTIYLFGRVNNVAGLALTAINGTGTYLGQSLAIGTQNTVTCMDASNIYDYPCVIVPVAQHNAISIMRAI